jgi:uroporphyrinogen-III synthase
MSQPLAGRRIIVTRTRQQAGTLTAALQQLGAAVIELPTIEIVPPDSWEPLNAALRSLANYQWLIVTSANAVRVISERLTVLRLPALRDVHPALKIAAIGPSTAEALAALDAPPDLVPVQSVAESLVDALRDQVAGTRVLLVRASVARDIIPEALTQLGASVGVADAYQTIVPESSAAAIQDLFRPETPPAAPAESPTPDAITFTSSSTVKHFLSLLTAAGLQRPLSLQAISIGPITSATLRQNGWEPTAEAHNHDINGLVEAVIRALASG